VDTDLNIAYVGSVDSYQREGVNALRLDNHMIRLVYKNQEGNYVEVNRIKPVGDKSESNYPDTVYIMALLPGGVGPETKADLWSINSDGGHMPPATIGTDKLNTYIKGIPLHRKSDVPTSREYNMYLSDPITVTLKPHDTVSAGEKKILSGDWLRVNLSSEVASKLSYMDTEDCYEIWDKKRSVRADLVDRVENLETGQEDKPNSPINNPSVYDGVLLQTKEFVYSDVDLHIPGRGFDFTFARTYRSQTIYPGPLGWGWDHIYNKRLVEMTNGDVIYYDGTGRRDRYSVYSYTMLGGISVSAGWKSPDGSFNTLKRMQDGSFRLMFSDNSLEIFDSYGRLWKLQDNNHNRMEFFYNIAGQLSEVMDTMGRMISFEYYEFDPEGTIAADAGRLWKIKDFTGREVKYEYNKTTGDLEKVYFIDRLKKYDYNLNSDIKLGHNLRTYTDQENRVVLVVNYDGDDKVTRLDRGDAQIGFRVGDETGDETTKEVIVTDGRGIEHRFVIDDAGHTKSVTDGDGFVTDFTINAITGLVDKVIYPRQNSTEFYYKAKTSLLQSIVDKPGLLGVDDINETERVTTYSYDDMTKNLISITGPDGAQEKYTYNEYGQITSAARFIDGLQVGQGTTYSYYSEYSPGGSTPSESPRELDSTTGGYLENVGNAFNSIENWNESLHNNYTYDERGNLLKLQSSDGITSFYGVDDYDDLRWESIVSADSLSPLNYYATYNYYNNDNLLSTTTNYGVGEDKVSNTHTYTYTVRDMVETDNEIGKGITTNTYDRNDNLENITKGIDSITFGFNNRDLISTVQTGDSPGLSTLSYDDNGNMMNSSNPYGHTTTYGYDGYDRLKTVSDPLTNQTVIKRYDMGRRTVTTFQDAEANLLRETEEVRDPVGRMQQYMIKGPNIQDEVYSYEYTTPNELGGETVLITNAALNRTWTVVKDNKGQVIREIDPALNETNYEYTYEKGKLKVITKTEIEKQEEGPDKTYMTQYRFNDFNKVETITENPGTAEEFITTFYYDEKGNLKGTVDAEGNAVEHKYDGLGRKEWTKRYYKGSPEAITTSFTYYDNDLLETITDDSANERNTTRYVYDGQKRVIDIFYPDGTFIHFTYSEKTEGEKKYMLVTMKQRNGTEVDNKYDALNRLESRTVRPVEGVQGTTSETYRYDGLSRLIEATNNDWTVTRQYDPLNRITMETQGTKSVSYNYSVVDNNRKMTVTYPNQRTIEKDFDILNRLSKIQQNQQRIAEFSYIGRSYRLMSKQYGNSNAMSYLYDYDQGRRLTFKEIKNNITESLINRYRYGYNKVHMKMYEQRGHDSDKGDVFAYDEFRRLTGVKFNSPEPTVPTTTQFDKSWSAAYDKVDNILNIVKTETGQPDEVITPTIDQGSANQKLNQYTTFLDGWGLEYDGNGNTTRRGTQEYTYDYRNQIVKAVDGSSTTTFKYDALGRRIEKTTGSDTMKYYYDGDQVIEERDGTDALKKQFIYGSGIDEIVRMDKYDGATSTPYYFHTNGIGSVTAITGENGDLVERVSYDTFGKPSFTDAASQPLTSSSIGNDILFQGRRYDKETNLYYYRARYYDPIMGRFLQTDPMGYRDSMNLYQGFNMNPINFLDPWGLAKINLFIGIEMNARNAVIRHFDGYKLLIPYPKWTELKKLAASKHHILNIFTKDEFHFIQTKKTVNEPVLGSIKVKYPMPYNFSKEGFEASIEDEDTWTFFCGHSSHFNKKYDGIAFTRTSSIKTPKTSKNEYIGIFGCSSSDYASNIFSNAKWIFSVKDKSGEGTIIVQKTLYAVYFLIEYLITTDKFSPEKALKAANDGLLEMDTNEQDRVILENPPNKIIYGGK
jgi:RHS repeat-associated protein